MKRILLTGTTGFVGRPLAARLLEKGYDLVASVRHCSDILPQSNLQLVDDLTSMTDWSNAIDAVSIVIHTAARVHVMSDSVADPLAEFRRVNLEGTVNLAKQAATAGVKRFIFLSSIKVNGESTRPGMPFTADDSPAPVDPYGISKAETEQALQELSVKTGMEVVIIRPVLVYGPGVKANFLSMMRWLNRGIPMPFGEIHNKRSLVALDNLVDLIITCVDHPAAANQIFLVSDGEDLSSTELLKRVSLSLGSAARLVPVPVGILNFAARLLGKREVAQRLFGSLQVDITKTRDLLGWTPPVSVDDALQKTAHAFIQQKRG